MAKTNLINLIGVITYIVEENGQWKAALAMNDAQVKKLRDACKTLYPNLEPITPNLIEEGENKGLWKVYIKSRYAIQLIDEASQKVNEPLYKGAEVIARCAITEYEYMKKHGVTLYVNAILVKKNGTPTVLTAESFND